MITCKFVGELGNNLFQLATLLNIHVTMNIDYCIPNHRIYWNDNNINTLEFPQLFNYEFNYNNIDLQNYIHFDRLPTNDSKYTHKYSEIKTEDNVCIEGYFQCEKYFKTISNKLKTKYFEFKPTLINSISEKYGDLSTTAAVHVRHGRDRLHDCIFAKSFNQFNDVYYRRAIQFLVERYDVRQILLISDHIEWCKNNISIPNVVFIENSTNIEDFVLFSLCKYNVLGNSTFSWWASYLNKTSPVKIIPPPSKYFYENSALSMIDVSDMYIDDTYQILEID